MPLAVDHIHAAGEPHRSQRRTDAGRPSEKGVKKPDSSSQKAYSKAKRMTLRSMRDVA